MPATPGPGIYNKSKTFGARNSLKNRFSSTRPSDAVSPSVMLPPGTAESGSRGCYRTSPLQKHQGALNMDQYNQILNNIAGENILQQHFSKSAGTTSRRNG